MIVFDLLFWVVLALAIFAKPNQVPQDERWVLSMFGAYSRTLYPRKPIPPFSVRFLEKIVTTRQDKPAEQEAVAKKNDEKAGVEIVHEFVDERYRNTPKGVRSTRTYIRGFIVKNTITKDGITIPQIHVQMSNRLMTIEENEATNKGLKKKEKMPAAYKNAYSLGSPIREALKVVVGGVVRSTVGKHPLEAGILEEPDEIQKEIETGITQGLEPWGEHLNWIMVEEVIPPEDVQRVLRAPFEAAKGAVVTVTTAKADGDAAEARAKGAAVATVTAANADKDASIARADGVKQALELEAEGKFAAIKKLAKAFGYKEDGDAAANEKALEEARNYMLSEEQYKAIATLGSNGGTVIIPAGAEGVGSLVATVKGLMSHTSKGTALTSPTSPSTAQH